MLARYKLERHKKSEDNTRSGRKVRKIIRKSTTTALKSRLSDSSKNSDNTPQDEGSGSSNVIKKVRKDSSKMRKTVKRKKVVKEKWSDKNSKTIDDKEERDLCTNKTTETVIAKEDAEMNTTKKDEKDLPKPFIFHKESLNLSDRPIRAAAATAQAISEAQQEFLEIEPPPEFKRNKHGQIEVLVDKPIKPRKYFKRSKTVSHDLSPDISEKEAVIYSEETLPLLTKNLCKGKGGQTISYT